MGVADSSSASSSLISIILALLKNVVLRETLLDLTRVTKMRNTILLGFLEIIEKHNNMSVGRLYRGGVLV